MGTCVRLTSQGSALSFAGRCGPGTRTSSSPPRTTLPRPVLLRVLLVLAAADADRYPPADADRYPPAAARFGARLVAQRKLSVAEAQLAFAALQTLAGPEPFAGGEALVVLLEQHREGDGARYLEE